MASSTGTSFTSSTPPVPRACRACIASQPIATPTHGAGGSFSVCASINISAPPDAVFAVLADLSRWPEWNRFVRKATADPKHPRAPQASPPDSFKAEKDLHMVFHVHMDPVDPESRPREENILVTVLEPYEVAGERRKGWRIAWRATSYPSMVLRSERVQEFVDDGAGNTEYTCWETFYGPLAPVVRWAVGKQLETAFQCWSEDLKKQAEEGVKRGSAPPPS